MKKLVKPVGAKTPFARVALPLLLALGGAMAPLTGAQAAHTDDASVVQAVRQNLAMVPDLPAQDIVVTARDGIVRLDGWVNRPRQEAEARRQASKVPGVTGVESRIRTWASDNES